MVVVLAAALATTPTVPADAAPSAAATTTTTTTRPGAATAPSSSSTTTVPGDAPDTVEEPVPEVPDPVPTTEPPAPLPTLPPELASDPRAGVLADPGPDDGGGPPAAQRPWDPSSNVVLLDRVKAAREAIATTRAELRRLEEELAASRATEADLAEQAGRMDAESRQRVAAAAAARRELRDHAVQAFITGRHDTRIVSARVQDPTDLGVARRYLQSVVQVDDRALRAYEAARDELTVAQRSLADDVAAAAGASAALAQRAHELGGQLIGLAQELRAYETGSHVYVRGFVFPVAAPVEFIDSWGFPRMTGTASAHWHQGTDVFAAHGAPLVAAESGRVTRVGQASLGGNRLWIVGDSGAEYYYAHLSAFAPGLVDGLRVNAGDLVGFVGDTGNARGTSPHLHFEVHPGGTGPVNPFPLLRATYGTRPMVQVVPAPAGAPPVIGG